MWRLSAPSTRFCQVLHQNSSEDRTLPSICPIITTEANFSSKMNIVRLLSSLRILLLRWCHRAPSMLNYRRDTVYAIYLDAHLPRTMSHLNQPEPSGRPGDILPDHIPALLCCPARGHRRVVWAVSPQPTSLELASHWTFSAPCLRECLLVSIALF